MEFGKFLAYYADAPEREKVVVTKEKKPQSDKQKLQNKAAKGYKRLFINLGRRDGFYPGELMQTLNRFVGGRQEVGHIDLLDTISYFEVPEKDAKKVMIQLSGIRYKGRTVRSVIKDALSAVTMLMKVVSQANQKSLRNPSVRRKMIGVV